MLSCQPSFISFSVSTNVLTVPKGKIQNGLLNNFKASFFPHALCTVKAMIIQYIIFPKHTIQLYVNIVHFINVVLANYL